MSQTKLLFIYFLMGLILGGVSGALYLVASVKFGKIKAEFLKYAFNQLAILWIIIVVVTLLASLVFK